MYARIHTIEPFDAAKGGTEKGTSCGGNQLGRDMFLAAENMTKKVP